MNDEYIREIIRYYREQGAPQDQQMLIALLREIQEESGGAIPQAALLQIAGAYEIRETMILALIRRISGLCTEDVPHRLEICGTCRAGAKLRNEIERTYTVKSGGSSTAGFSYRVTPCMKNCKNGPSIRWDGKLYGNADMELIRTLMER